MPIRHATFINKKVKNGYQHHQRRIIKVDRTSEGKLIVTSSWPGLDSIVWVYNKEKDFLKDWLID